MLAYCNRSIGSNKNFMECQSGSLLFSVIKAQEDVQSLQISTVDKGYYLQLYYDFLGRLSSHVAHISSSSKLRGLSLKKYMRTLHYNAKYIAR